VPVSLGGGGEGGEADYPPTPSAEVMKIKHPQNIIVLPFTTGKKKYIYHCCYLQETASVV
jgi:hypothetical protein